MVKKSIFVLMVFFALILIVVKHNAVINDNVEKADINLLGAKDRVKHVLTDEEIRALSSTTSGVKSFVGINVEN